MNDTGDQTVLTDPQYGIVRTLRPFDGYTTVYNGQSAGIPIQMTELGQPLDQLAGQPGYDPKLLRGIETPLGSRVLLWLPQTGYIESEGPTVVERYKWQIIWRFRNTHDHRVARKPYHYPKQGIGAPDTSSGAAVARTVIPAANETVEYLQTEPSGFTRTLVNIRSADFGAGSASNPLPLLPDGTTGVIQQGVQDPGVTSSAAQPGFQPFELRSKGDEMLIGVLRDTDVVPNWGFTEGGVFPATADLLLQVVFAGSQDVGVYVSVGVAP